ncbi:Rha family transcriptional regulator [Mesorhizobium sp. KR1-2]|uniref:Rha family transcriptional regulator n=1 Tax=Mesorhizobium sp. KR1-2 TaxID=3156609 RepID=UPI0032B5505E
MQSVHSTTSVQIPPAQTVNTPITMSSREIAGLTGKRHPDVKRDIERMLSELQEDVSKFAHIYFDSMNRGQTEFRLDRELTETLLLGYSAPLRRKVLIRLRELEGIVAGSSLAIPNFSDPVAAARAWADQVEARRLAEQTKAEIGSRREATAMNTASQAVKKAGRLQIELDRSRQYATVKRMEMLYHGQQFSWRLLKSTSTEMGIASIDVFDANYGTVKAYHADVWREAYALDIPAADGEVA